MNLFIKRKEGMKKGARLWCALIFAIAVLSSVRVPAAAASWQGVKLHWSSTATTSHTADPAYLIGGVTYVPFRSFATLADDCDIRWDGKTQTAYATTSAGATVSAGVGKEYIMYGERCFYTAAPVRMIGDRVYVPVRPLARCFGVDVTWNASSRSVSLTRTGQTVRSDAGVYDADALYWLSRIISAEAKSEPFRGQVAVGNVVLNRVRSAAFPNSIYGVIFDRKNGVQFSPTANGSIYHTPTADAVRAAKICLEGVTLSDGILYFFNPAIAQSHWISANRTYAFRIGGHVFYV